MSKEQQILQAALELFVAHGFEGTPTSKIAAHAGVSNGTLFHYFKTKEELVTALYNGIKIELAHYIAPFLEEESSLEARIKTVFIRSLYWALDNRAKFYYVQQFHFSPHLAKISPDVMLEQSRFHFQLLAEGLQTKLLKPLPVDLLFTLISSHVYGLYQYLTASHFAASQQKALIEQGFSLLWSMIKA